MAAIHGLELLPDRTFRFKTVVILVSRQKGKTKFMQNLILHRMLIMGAPLVLGVTRTLPCRGNLEADRRHGDRHPLLPPRLKNVRTANGDEALALRPLGDGDGNFTSGSRYKIAQRTAPRAAA